MPPRRDRDKCEEQLLREQFAMLVRVNPFVLALLLVADILYVIDSNPVAGSVIHYAPPLLFGLIAIARAHYWLKVRKNIIKYDDIDVMKRTVNRAMSVAAVMSVLAAVGTATIITDFQGDRKIALISLVLTSAIVSSSCLAIVPQIAIAVIGSAFVPIIYQLANSENFAMQFTAAAAAVLGVYQTVMILARFQDLKEIVVSHEKLRAAQMDLEAAEQAARLQAHTDCLTGFHNRHGFDALITKAEINPSGRIAIALIDLDGFKEVNDRYGHAAGDMALKLVAGRLFEKLHQLGELVRLGGDEFALICQDETWFPMLQDALDDAIEQLRRPFTLMGTDTHIGASSGLCIGESGEHVETILAAADRALYDAKRNGKGRNKMARKQTSAAERARSWSISAPIETAPSPQALVNFNRDGLTRVPVTGSHGISASSDAAHIPFPLASRR